MSKTEDIEAKLAAYIDGELDTAQRAEIEKHLAAHPKHRALIEELMSQKDLLKALPRQVAPADLAGWLEALPVQRGLTAERRERIVELIRSLAAASAR